MPGDPVLTTDGTAQNVVAVYQTPADPTGASPPIRFETGALGHNMPSTPLIVTANHRMLCASRLVQRMFGEAAVLLPAKRFLGLPGVTIDPASAGLGFIHLELATLRVICANGALAESCLLGPVARQSLPRILQSQQAGRATTPLRFPVPAGHQQRQFVRRLAKNSQPVIDKAAHHHYLDGLRGPALARA